MKPKLYFSAERVNVRRQKKKAVGSSHIVDESQSRKEDSQ